MVSTSETESESENGPKTKEEYERSIAWKLGQVKPEPAKKKPKNLNETKKRVAVGCYIFAWYTTPTLVSPLCEALFLLPFLSILMNEMHNIKKKEFENQCVFTFLRYMTVLLFHFTALPLIGIFDRSIVEASGMTEEEYPIFFKVFYEHHGAIVTVTGVICFGAQLCLWRRRNMRYQL